MITQVFSVFDTKIGSFAQPFFSPTTASAMRAFVDAARDVQTTISKHPQDFHLYHLGSFDDETGAFDPFKPVNLCSASGLLVAPENC